MTGPGWRGVPRDLKYLERLSKNKKTKRVSDGYKPGAVLHYSLFIAPAKNEKNVFQAPGEKKVLMSHKITFTTSLEAISGEKWLKLPTLFR